MSHVAFFYGTLMAPQVLQRVLDGHVPAGEPNPRLHRDALIVRPALLHQHQRHKVKNADYPAVVPSSAPGASVRGSLVSGLTDADIWRLDIFEGSEYERRNVSVQVLPLSNSSGAEEEVQGEEVAAQTYIWTAGMDRLEPDEWDFDEFVREKMVRWVGSAAAEADEGFRDVDNAFAVTVLQDPTGGRGADRTVKSARVNEEAFQGAV